MLFGFADFSPRREALTIASRRRRCAATGAALATTTSRGDRHLIILESRPGEERGLRARMAVAAVGYGIAILAAFDQLDAVDGVSPRPPGP